MVEPGGAALPLSADSDRAVAAGPVGRRPVDLFGEWDGFALTPLSVAADGALVSL